MNPRHVLIISNHKGAIRIVSLMNPSQQEKMIEAVNGEEAIGINFPVKNLTLLIKCENGSLIRLQGV